MSSTEAVIESAWDAPESVYDRGAATYDAMVSSRLYNRLAWGTDPADYAAFACDAVESGDGPLLDVAAPRPRRQAPTWRVPGRWCSPTDPRACSNWPRAG